jgi:hypothetical protein
MSRITKTIAENVAEKMVATRIEAAKLKENIFLELLYDKVKYEIPKDVLSFYEKHQNYFKNGSEVRVSGNGFDYQYFCLDKKLPRKDNYGRIEYFPSQKDAKELLSYMDAYQLVYKEAKELRKEIEVTLFNLRTYKSVQENFPEASEYLPKIQTTALALNISDLRNKINQSKEA